MSDFIPDKMQGFKEEDHRELISTTETLKNIERFVQCDATAISYQSLGQYRKELLKIIREGK